MIQRLISKVLSKRIRSMRWSSLKTDNLINQSEINSYKNASVLEVKKEKKYMMIQVTCIFFKRRI